MAGDIGGEGIESRLRSAAEALREHEVTARRHADLDQRAQVLGSELTVLREQLRGEQKDVERLEGLSLTRLLASLRGDRDGALDRERAQAEMARYRVAEAEARLAAIERERAAAQARLGEVAEAPTRYATVLEEKERHLRESGDWPGPRLLELADEQGRITGELRELTEAIVAADEATAALEYVQTKLGSASNWSTYDTYLGGGMVSSMIKHSRLDDAAQAAAYADERLAVLRTELADLPDAALDAPHQGVSGLTRFVDIFLDNIFTDFVVGQRIKQARQSVTDCVLQVDRLRDHLERCRDERHDRLAVLDRERRELLTTPPA